MLEELNQLGLGFDIDLAIRILSLVFSRFLGAALAIPFLGGQLIPGRLKFGLPLVFAVFLYPIVAASVPKASVPPLGFPFIFLVAKEVFAGYALGYVVSLPFSAVEMAGSFMDTQRGTTFAQVLAPLLGGQTSLLGQLYLLLYITIFLTIGGAHLIIQGIGESYRVLPILDWPAFVDPHAQFVPELIGFSADIFRAGLVLSAPVVVAMLLTDLTLGVVNRTAPQVQVFWLGMPLKTLGGLVIVLFALGYTAELFAVMTVDTAVALKRAILVFARGA